MIKAAFKAVSGEVIEKGLDKYTISVSTACKEKPDTSPQPTVPAPLILLTLLVFHPHCLSRSIHTSITLPCIRYSYLFMQRKRSSTG